MNAARKMPARLNLGQHHSFTIGHTMMVRERWNRNDYGVQRDGLRSVMGFNLPSWQRGLVWTDAQSISFIESAWRGINLGTYTYNQAGIGSPYDMLLIDGQQRMYALQRYLDDEFPVFGWHWSEVTESDRNAFDMGTIFAAYVTRSEDEAFLRSYYNLMNFGGVAHKESERA